MFCELASEIRSVFVAIRELSQEEFNGGMALFYASTAICSDVSDPHLIFNSNGNTSPEEFKELLKYIQPATLIVDANNILEENADLEWILEKRFRKMKKWESMNLKA